MKVVAQRTLFGSNTTQSLSISSMEKQQSQRSVQDNNNENLMQSSIDTTATTLGCDIPHASSSTNPEMDHIELIYNMMNMLLDQAIEEARSRVQNYVTRTSTQQHALTIDSFLHDDHSISANERRFLQLNIGIVKKMLSLNDMDTCS